jgi:hypothetical protein
VQFFYPSGLAALCPGACCHAKGCVPPTNTELRNFALELVCGPAIDILLLRDRKKQDFEHIFTTQQVKTLGEIRKKRRKSLLPISGHGNLSTFTESKFKVLSSTIKRLFAFLSPLERVNSVRIQSTIWATISHGLSPTSGWTDGERPVLGTSPAWIFASGPSLQQTDLLTRGAHWNAQSWHRFLERSHWLSASK